MISLKSLKWEYKISSIFSVFALITSFLIGMITGNGIAVVLIRAILLSTLFAGIGFGIVYVIRKFVPELFEVIESKGAETSESAVVEEENIAPGDVLAEAHGEESIENKANTEEEAGAAAQLDFEPMGRSTIPQYETSHLDSAESGEGRGSNLGRHFFEKEGIKYEPKLVADAIRTMMQKDNE
jgi:hypothetical protein